MISNFILDTIYLLIRKLHKSDKGPVANEVSQPLSVCIYLDCFEELYIIN